LSREQQGRIVSTPGAFDGKPHVAGHRLTVQQIVICHRRGRQSPEDIIADYPGLTLADVHAALAYYFDHQTEIDADIEADDMRWAEVERQNALLLAAKLAQRTSGGTSGPRALEHRPPDGGQAEP
jgi:uncharacterized protein (DUF433 family)